MCKWLAVLDVNAGQSQLVGNQKIPGCGVYMLLSNFAASVSWEDCLWGRAVEAELLVYLNVQPSFMCRFWICSQHAPFMATGASEDQVLCSDAQSWLWEGFNWRISLVKESDLGAGGKGEHSVTEPIMSLTWRKEDTLVAFSLLLKGLVTVCTPFPSGGLWMRSLGSWANRELKELWWEVTKVVLMGVLGRQTLQRLCRVPSGLRNYSGLPI